MSAVAIAALSLANSTFAEGNNLLNVSYDVARDFYKDYNPLFQKYVASQKLVVWLMRRVGA